MKKKSLFFLILLFILAFNTVNVFAEKPGLSSMNQERAKVLEVTNQKNKDSNGVIQMVQEVKLKILTGDHKGEIVDVENPLSDNEVYDVKVKKGDKVLVGIEIFNDKTAEVYISDFSRQEYIFVLMALFIGLIAIIGGEKGLKAILTLLMTIGIILKVLLPLMLKGINPIPVSVVISILITILTIFIISGISTKSIAAIIGTSSGVIVAGLISFIIGSKVKLTGLSGEEAMALAHLKQGLDIRNLLFAGIILGALGAIMDVGMSVASSIEEIYNANNKLTQKELFKSGMNVGKDIMGTMTNTLILAYTGSSIPLLLIFMSFENNLVKVINLDIIATEIIRSLSGSIGLVLTIPLTAFIASKLIIKRDENKLEDNMDKN